VGDHVGILNIDVLFFAPARNIMVICVAAAAFLVLLFLAFVESHTTSNYMSGGEVANTIHERGGRVVSTELQICLSRVK
jgi:hypothetical protein